MFLKRSMFHRMGVMNPKNYLFALLLGVLWVSHPISAAAEKWPIKEFKVFQKKPGVLVGSQVISDEMAKEIERWLKRLAQEYESMGFKPPTFSPIEESLVSNKKVLPIYAYPFSTGGQAAMLSPCGWNQAGEVVKVDTYMTVDSGRNVENGKLTTKAYQDLAHELFHAVQNSYGLFTGDCNAPPGAWLTEGTAEAVGIEMARKLYPKKKPEHICSMGMRLYNKSLYTNFGSSKTADLPCQGAKLDYQALSFWQFLGEWRTGYDNTSPEVFVEPDFRYLHNFFNTTHAMGTPSQEYAWLTKVLGSSKRSVQHQFGMSLQSAYSKFVNRFASYWRPRRTIILKGGIGGSLTEQKWMNWIYGTCEHATLHLDGSGATATVTPQINPVAARCIKIDFQGISDPVRVNLTFYATGNNTSIDLASLVIGTNGGEKEIQWHPANQGSEKIGYITVIAQPSHPQFFTVSYVPTDFQPGALNPSIRIVPEIVSASAAKAKKKDDSTPDPTPDKELVNTLESRSWTGQAFQKQKGPCTPRPFEARPCGPVTKLELGLESDAAKVARESIQPGMSVERMMDVMGAIDKKGGDQVVNELIEQQMDILKQDGAGVSVVIPQIQPGYTGTMSNAHLGVSKALNPDGSDNGGYDALGPWVGSCQNGYWPSTGKLTIEEFSQYVIRGSFSAQLVDSSTRKTCQSAPIAKSINGTFIISEIHWGQNQSVPKVGDDAIIDRTVEDFNEFLPGLITDDLKEAAKEQAKKKRQEQKQAKQKKMKYGANGSVIEECGCRCEMEANFCNANPNAKCCVSCEPLFKLCKGELQSHSALLSAEEQAKEVAEVQAMRQRYEAYVDSLGLPNEAIKQQMMQAFDDLKTIDEKKMFMMSIPH